MLVIQHRLDGPKKTEERLMGEKKNISVLNTTNYQENIRLKYFPLMNVTINCA